MTSISSCKPRLIPIRVDAFLNGKIRIVDTLLVDPNVMPLPHKGLTENCEYWAYNLLADTEVLGVSRNGRAFTGRLDLYSKELLKMITSQIETQLRVALRPPKKGPLPLVLTDNSEKVKQEVQADNMDCKSGVANELIPIRLRLSVHGVRIHDDFDWDPNLGLSPIEFAIGLGDDLNLSVEAKQAVAVSIVEQIHGGKIEQIEAEKDEGGPTQRTATTAAWRLEQRVHITNVAWLVEHHKKSQ